MITTSFKQLLLLALLTFSFSCGSASQEQSQNQPGADNAANVSTPVFQFSTAPPPESGNRTANWCYSRFGESLVVSAETVNTNRRYFFLPTQGITKLVVGRGAKMTLLFRPLPNGNVEVYTGANLPECLSQPSNLNPAGGAPAMYYDNGKNIHFSMDMAVENGRTRLTVELPPGLNYGISANNCLDCQ
ncbi:MAG: hypothetical protein EP344_07350 [Bacteroidetes bacterium]|nr:MAG: hypothetical protein EP344_07350 [Bacteroidota bacterium]